jgi:hypothetical protein
VPYLRARGRDLEGRGRGAVRPGHIQQGGSRSGQPGGQSGSSIRRSWAPETIIRTLLASTPSPKPLTSAGLGRPPAQLPGCHHQVQYVHLDRPARLEVQGELAQPGVRAHDFLLGRCSEVRGT